MNIFDQYGIKEVMDVTLYSIHKKKDGSGGVYYVPALYLDTLKVSTIEESGENTWATGGIGNGRLINWNYGKTINITLEDALCTPASLGMCWGGILSADWKDAQIDISTDVCSCKNPVGRIDRMEACIYPRSSNEPTEHLVSRLIPQTHSKAETYSELDELLKKSEVVDGTRVQGTGQVGGHAYKWRLIIESGVRSVAQVPDRFFDIEGRSYPIDWNSKVSVFNGEAPAYSNFKDAIIYKIGSVADMAKAKPYIIFDAWMDNHGNVGKDGATISLQQYLTQYGFNASTEGTLVESEGPDGSNVAHNVPYSDHSAEELAITSADYLAIVVDNNDIYHAFVGKETETKYADKRTYTDSKIAWFKPKKAVNVNQFKGLDMWLRFSGINAMTYFILTKYGQDILSIIPSFRKQPDQITNPPKTEYRGYKIVTDADPVTGDPVNERKIYLTEWTIYNEEPTPSGDIKGYDSRVQHSEDPDAKVDEQTTEIEEYDELVEARKKNEGKLWAYVNPRTMQPYDDDYWFHEGEPYYVKSLTIAPKGKQIKANKIVVKADQWPGMYMVVGETYIRDRDTGEDERMQIKFPLCKVQADQTLTLQADGDPTVNLNAVVKIA